MRIILCCTLLLLVMVGCGSTKTVTRTVTVSATAKSGAGSPREVVEFGYIRSLTANPGTFLGVGSACQHAGATAGAGTASEGRAGESRRSGEQHAWAAAFHGLPRLGSCPDRFGDARSRARDAQSRLGSRFLARPSRWPHRGPPRCSVSGSGVGSAGTLRCDQARAVYDWIA